MHGEVAPYNNIGAYQYNKKSKDKDRNPGMASWNEIMENMADMKSVFGTEDITQLNMDEKMHPVMVAMLKLHKAVGAQVQGFNNMLRDEDEGLIAKVSNHTAP